MILMIIGAAAVFSYMMSLLYVTQTAAPQLVDLNLTRSVLLRHAQCVPARCRLLPAAVRDRPVQYVMPILTPVLEANGFDLIWFAVDPDDQHRSQTDHASGAPDL